MQIRYEIAIVKEFLRRVRGNRIKRYLQQLEGIEIARGCKCSYEEVENILNGIKRNEIKVKIIQNWDIINKMEGQVMGEIIFDI